MTICGARSFFVPQEHDCLETDKEVVVTDSHPEPKKNYQTIRKTKTESIGVNLGEEGEKGQLIFTSASMPVDLEQALLIKEIQRRFCMDLC